MLAADICIEESGACSLWYLYGVLQGCRELTSGKTGISGHEVCFISNGEFQAIAQRIYDENFLRKSLETPAALQDLLIKHEEVLEYIQAQRAVTVLPASFGALLKGEGAIREWLARNASGLREKMVKVHGKSEYGIRIFCDSNSLGENVLASDAEIKKLEEDIKTMAPGKAYLFRQKLERLARTKVEEKCSELSRIILGKIENVLCEVKRKKITEAQIDAKLFMNLAVLADKKSCTALGEVLDKINAIPDIKVEFTGPWLAYSFI